MASFSRAMGLIIFAEHEVVDDPPPTPKIEVVKNTFLHWHARNDNLRRAKSADGRLENVLVRRDSSDQDRSTAASAVNTLANEGNEVHGTVSRITDAQALRLLGKAANSVCLWNPLNGPPPWNALVEARKSQLDTLRLQRGIKLLAEGRVSAYVLTYAPIAIVRDLTGKVCECLEHKNANFVIQQIVMFMPENCLVFVLRELAGKAVWAAKRDKPCRVLVKLVERVTAYGASIWFWQMVVTLINEILAVPDLCRDEFGKYVLEAILELQAYRELVVRIVRNNLADNARDIHGTRLVERILTVENRMLKYCSYDTFTVIVDELLACRATALTLVQSDYGIFTVRSILRTGMCSDKVLQLMFSVQRELNNLPIAKRAWLKCKEEIMNILAANKY